MVKPSALRRRIVAPICWTITGARPSVGSSSSSRRAPVRRMRPIASICCSPPDSLVPWVRRRSRRLGNRSKIAPRSSPPEPITGGNMRFSSTLRLAKIPRSSGQNARPSRAMRFEGRRISSAAPKRTEPRRLSTIPITDLSVVVLPAPFRPSSVTTSPVRTSRSTPWRMCDSPYQASRSRTVRSGSGIARPHVRLDHVGVLRDGGVVALGQDLAARQHGDRVGQVLHHLEVVLDHEHGTVRGDALDERRDPVHVFVGHAGGGLVEQHHLRVERERRRDLERALAAVRQLDRDRPRELRQADRVEELEGAPAELAEDPLPAPEGEPVTPRALEREPHVLQHGEVREDRRDLERPDEAEPREDRKSTRLNSSHSQISYAVFCLKKKKRFFPMSVTSPYTTSCTTLPRAPARV